MTKEPKPHYSILQATEKWVHLQAKVQKFQTYTDWAVTILSRWVLSSQPESSICAHREREEEERISLTQPLETEGDSEAERERERWPSTDLPSFLALSLPAIKGSEENGQKEIMIAGNCNIFYFFFCLPFPLFFFPFLTLCNIRGANFEFPTAALLMCTVKNKKANYQFRQCSVKNQRPGNSWCCHVGELSHM